jgi:hypothetical protein
MSPQPGHVLSRLGRGGSLIRMNTTGIAIVFPFIVIASFSRLAAQTPGVAGSTPTFHVEVNLSG